MDSGFGAGIAVALFALLVAVVIFGVGWTKGYADASRSVRHEWQREAVVNGHGEYLTTPNGIEFKWK